MANKDIFIIGGGVAGLLCAQRLGELGYKVTVAEADTAVGGLAKSFFHNNKWIPITYHHVLIPDRTTQRTIAKFGLSGELCWINSEQVFWHGDRFYPLSKPYHILTFNPLSLRSKVNLFLFGLYVWGKRDWSNTAEINCEQWLRKNVGDEITDVLFKNLLEIKFNMPLSSISMAWLGQRLHQSVRNYDRYGYVTVGLQTLIDRIKDSIISNGGTVKTDMRVSRIGKNEIEAKDRNGKDQIFKAARIVSTVPPPVLYTLMEKPKKYAFLNDIKYKSIISFVCGSTAKLSNCYWSVVLSPLLTFGGFFNHTVLNPADVTEKENIYYFFTYVDSDSALFMKGQEELIDMYVTDIKRLFPDFVMSWGRIFKIKYSAPVYAVHYSNPPIELDDNLYLAGVYRTYPRPRTMDAAFESGIETAQYIHSKDTR